MSTPAARGKVLHICAVPETAFVLLSSLIQQQRREGYQVEVACGEGDDTTASEQLEVPVNVFPLSRAFFSGKNLAGAREMARFIQKGNFGFVHTHNPIASFVGRRAAALAGAKRVIYHMRGTVWGAKPILEPVFTLMERIASKWTNHTITINCADARDMVRKGIASESKVSCIHCGACGLDTGYFSRDSVPAGLMQKVKDQIGIKKDDYLITFIGRLVRDKGIMDLLDAFAVAKAGDPGLKLLIVGSVLRSERDQSFKVLYDRWKRRNSWIPEADVINVGFSHDVRPYLGISNVLVLPSYREGFGMVLAEAAAMGIPSITTDTRGGLEAVVGGETGLIVKRRQPKEIAAAIGKLRHDAALSQQMGAKARLRAIREFDHSIVYERVSRIYERLRHETSS
jgi:glycosyltransferase involved in cell wall biosynthesis